MNFSSLASPTSSPVSATYQITTPSQQVVNGRRYAWQHESSSVVLPNPTVNPATTTPNPSFKTPARQLTPKLPKDKVFDIYVLLHKITEYAPNWELRSVNRVFKEDISRAMAQIIYHSFFIRAGLRQAAPLRTEDGQPDYQTIGTSLSSYYRKMENEYKARLPLLKCEDYTPNMLNQTIPLGIFPTNPNDLFYLDWNSEDFNQRRVQLDSYEAGHIDRNFNFNASRKVSYFLSIPLGDDLATKVQEIFTKPKILNLLLTQDPPFLNRLFRYIMDQIHDTANQILAYHEGLYSMLNLLLNHHNKLSYEVLHYALLIHVQVVLFQTDVNESKLGLIESMLVMIKLKGRKTQLLKHQLELLVSDELEEARTKKKQKINKLKGQLTLEKESLKNHAKLIEIIETHFQPPICCVIS